MGRLAAGIAHEIIWLPIAGRRAAADATQVPDDLVLPATVPGVAPVA